MDSHTLVAAVMRRSQVSAVGILLTLGNWNKKPWSAASLKDGE